MMVNVSKHALVERVSACAQTAGGENASESAAVTVIFCEQASAWAACGDGVAGTCDEASATAFALGCGCGVAAESGSDGAVHPLRVDHRACRWRVALEPEIGRPPRAAATGGIEHVSQVPF